MPNRRPMVTPEEHALIIKLYTENRMSYREIGAKIDRTGECVGHRLRQAGIANNGIRFRDSEFAVPKYKFRKMAYVARRRRDIEFSVSIEYVSDLFLKQNGKCAYTGLPLKFGTTSKRFDGDASLDRIDSSIGYVEGNLQWTHKDVNMMKQQLTHDRFLELCKKITEYDTQKHK